MPTSKLVAIHQPNFFPWLGYFNKIARADQFVVLDTVQFPKKGGTWGNRVKILMGGEPKWLTMPVERNYHGVRGFAEMRLENSSSWREKLTQTLRSNYGSCPCFNEVFPALEGLVRNPVSGLTDYNLSAILYLAKELAIETGKIVRSSDLKTEGAGTDLLISITKSVNGTAYLCGGGAAGYQEDEKFAAAGLDLIYQNFEHPVYQQATTGEFVPGLSVIDALMNCGFARTRELIRSV